MSDDSATVSQVDGATNSATAGIAVDPESSGASAPTAQDMLSGVGTPAATVDSTAAEVTVPAEVTLPTEVGESAPGEVIVSAAPAGAPPGLRRQFGIQQMIAQPQAEAVPGDGGGEGGCIEEALLDLLRRLRAEVQDVRESINLVESGNATLVGESVYLQQARSELLEYAKALLPCAQANDNIAHVVNLLQKIEHCPLFSASTLSSQEQTNAVAIFKDQVQRLEYLIGTVTVPARLNKWLAESRPGYYVPFHAVFRNEIPNEADRRAILNLIAWAPKTVENGIVDVTSGVVYRCNKTFLGRALSVLVLLVSTLASLGIVWLIGRYLPLPDQTLTDVQLSARAVAYVIGWAAVALGVLAHLGVAGVKREQETQLPTVLAISNLGQVINARLGQMLWKLALIMLGFFVVIFAIDVNASPINAFLVGYSLDSIIGIFGTNMETRVKALQTQLTPK